MPGVLRASDPEIDHDLIRAEGEGMIRRDGQFPTQDSARESAGLADSTPPAKESGESILPAPRNNDPELASADDVAKALIGSALIPPYGIATRKRQTIGIAGKCRRVSVGEQFPDPVYLDWEFRR